MNHQIPNEVKVIHKQVLSNSITVPFADIVYCGWSEENLNTHGNLILDSEDFYEVVKKLYLKHYPKGVGCND